MLAINHLSLAEQLLKHSEQVATKQALRVSLSFDTFEEEATKLLKSPVCYTIAIHEHWLTHW
jgi:hypothetical protein